MTTDKPKPHPLLQQPLSPQGDVPSQASLQVFPALIPLLSAGFTSLPFISHPCHCTCAWTRPWEQSSWKPHGDKFAPHGSTKDAGHPQSLLLGVQTSQGNWGCAPAGCRHSTDEHWGCLLQKPLNSPHREEESCGHCCVDPCCSSGTMHTQAWEGQWQ